MIVFKNVSVVYPNGFKALSNINLTIEKGEFVSVIGPSGAGKSTLIRTINGFVKITNGDLVVNGKNLRNLSESELRLLRREIGMIFQSFNLVKRISVLRNVLVGRLGYTPTISSIFNLFSKKDIELAFENLRKVGIEDKAYVRADQLSGGQQQRVAIARALTQEPKIILADEPVASLDPPTAKVVMDYLKNFNKELGITTIINLHDVDLVREYGERVVGIRSGEVVYDGTVKGLTDKVLKEIYGKWEV
ncbi:MAG: phosphonate ABC transporter ATP-binding protein [candidate division WOR-3 bacterium]|nr:phosphonate ABC transporter ATP-binding protein [candidate division WOR-3 bacterium]MDW8151023.1 phosphonate ABC transporter ATP-binding protein [candidate division WOR-3 bacterium]